MKISSLVKCFLSHLVANTSYARVACDQCKGTHWLGVRREGGGPEQEDLLEHLYYANLYY